MKHLDLFSGIGGFALAARWAGFETVAFCEIEEFPRKVLRKNFPGVPIHHDIRELDGREHDTVELITGGYPCQPFSLAGQRNGAKDDRYLWPEMLRIITQARPVWVVAENVAGHISMGLDKVLFDLESKGYEAQSFVIPACAVDAPHRRDRVWIVAHSKSSNDGSSYSREIKRQTQEPGDSCSKNTLADTIGPRPQERKIFTRSESKARSTQPRQAAKRNNRWPAEPDVDRVAHGIPARVDRLRGLGNAIVPQVAYEILRCIYVL